MTETLPAYDPTRARRSLFSALIDARAKFGRSRAIVVDGDERTLTYDELLRAALALGHALKSGTKRGETVGVLLPTGVGSVIALLALSAYGRVPAMLNFTSGEPSLRTALKMAKIQRVVTAHRFIEIGKFETLESWLKSAAKLIYLDDVREKLSLFDKVTAAFGSFLPRRVATRVSPDSPAVILFTSGTEGEPKGVALSHANILANVEQVRAHIQFYPNDVVFNPLPTFHSFGLTVGALMPLYLGVKEVLHPTPRQPHEIVRRIKQHRATILLATDTFVSQYARCADAEELNSLRLAVCGAERLRDETRQLFRRKYTVELLEGYGVTEASPVLAANQPGRNRAGTVGHLLPDIEARVEPVEGIRDAGRLHVRGPNVMLGYIHVENPGEIVPPEGGWHDTGDVVAIDDEGYLSIRGRLKRFAKVGGESVSLSVVENCASALWPDHQHAAIAVPDDRRGESIVLVTTNPEASRSDLLVWVQNHGVPELAVPRRVIRVNDIPVMGSGKIDYRAVTMIVAREADSAPASVKSE